MKKLLTTLIAIMISTVALASDNASEQTIDIMAELSKQKTFQAKFEQINVIKDFGEDIYTGEVYIIMNEKALWNYTDPYVTWYMFTDKMVEQYDELNNQLMKYPLASSSDNVILQVLIDFSRFPNVFDVKQLSNTLLELTPKSDAGLTHLIIEYVDGKIISIESEDTVGNTTMIQFSDIKVDVPIEESAFEMELPEDVEIFEIDN